MSEADVVYVGRIETMAEAGRVEAILLKDGVVRAYADVTILSGDLLAATPNEIRSFGVLATIVGGTAEFCAAPELCRRV